MAEQYSGFFDGGGLYGQTEFNRYFDSIYESGIAVNADNTMQMAVSGSGTMLSVAVGFAIIRGFYLFNPATKNLTVPVGSRQDRVVVKMDKTVRSVTLYLKQGSTSAPPVLTRTDFVWELSLAKVTVNASGIVSVADERPDQTLCGAIRPKNLSEFNTWLRTIQSTWSSFIAGCDSTYASKLAGYDTAFTGKMTTMETTFNNWFNQIQGKTWRETYVQQEMPAAAPEGSLWIKTDA